MNSVSLYSCSNETPDHPIRDKPGSSGVVSEVVRFTLEADKHRLEKELKDATDKLKKFKKCMDTNAAMIADFK